VAQLDKADAACAEAETARPDEGLCHAAPHLSILRPPPPTYPLHPPITNARAHEVGRGDGGGESGAREGGEGGGGGGGGGGRLSGLSSAAPEVPPDVESGSASRPRNGWLKPRVSPHKPTKSAHLDVVGGGRVAGRAADRDRAPLPR
jgi:hypothetical protein